MGAEDSPGLQAASVVGASGDVTRCPGFMIPGAFLWVLLSKAVLLAPHLVKI